MNIFIDRYLLEGKILAELKNLELSWEFPDGTGPHTYFDGVKSLLDGCARALETLELFFPKVPALEEISDICALLCIVKFVTTLIMT